MFRHADTPESENCPETARPKRLSYKFQRLREQMRAAIENGDFGPKLPGERTLGRMFGVNAKTVNKALSDLTAEGLLERRIGQGTFVAQAAAPNGERAQRGQMFFCPGADLSTRLCQQLGSFLQAESGSNLQTSPARANGPLSLRDWPSTQRGKTAGLFMIAERSLSEPFEIDNRLLAQAQRRQTNMVVVGGCAESPKLNACTVDFVDAGFRLAEHLMRLGCKSVSLRTTIASRETDAVLNGARTASARYGIPIADTAGEDHGLILVGSKALDAFLHDANATAAWRAGKLAVCCIADLGDALPGEQGITAYETSTEDLAPWAAKLMQEARPGSRPVEYLVPGRLEIRHTLGQTQPAATNETASVDLPRVAI